MPCAEECSKSTSFELHHMHSNLDIQEKLSVDF